MQRPESSPPQNEPSQSGPLAAARLLVIVVVILLIGTLAFSIIEHAPSDLPVPARTSASTVSSQWREIEPVPMPKPIDAAKLALGKRLFSEALLSPHGNSCNSCHELANYGVSGKPLSPNLLGGFDQMNVPTVYNAALNGSQGWTGNTADLIEQVDKVIGNPKHMGSNWDYVEQALSDDASYREAFEQVYGREPHRDDIRDALVAFELNLLTPGAPFDRYLRGETAVLSEQQLTGYAKFREFGCVACHQGVNVGGNLMAKFGVFDDPFVDRPDNAFNQGRYLVTGLEADRYVFKVPSLRNIAKTAPYAHDGSVATLREMVALMGRYQLGRELAPNDLDDIVAFLNSLTAPIPEAAL